LVGGNRIPQLSERQRGFVLFSARFGDTTNAWRMPISDDGTPVGKAQRLTSGTAIETSPVLSAGGGLLFESLNTPYSIWSLPVDANHAEVRGELRRLTPGPFDLLPSISLDGKWLAFATARGKKISPQNAQVRIKNVDTGAETVISDASAPEAYPHISRDGSLIATDSPVDSNGILRVVETRNLASQRILGSGHAWDWSHDNKRLLYGKNDGGMRCLDIASGKDVFHFADAAYQLYQAKFAPGDQFVVVEAVDERGSRLFIVPIGKKLADSAEGLDSD
jgi:WD40 repeat protein